MARLPPKTREELPAEQQATHDMFTDVCQRSFGTSGENFLYATENGALMGPFPFFISHPDIGDRLMDLMRSMAHLPLPPAVREVAILTAAAQFGGGYVGYSHVSQAVNSGGLSLEQAQSLKIGQKSDNLSDGCNIAFEVAQYLCANRGPLPVDLWDQALEILGKETTLALLHYIGFYSYVAIALNGVDAPVPE